jgi:AcrR family transcriptional regulator
MREIATEAGVAPGLIYHYFPGKEGLLHALFERSAGLVMEAFVRVGHLEEPRERLAALLRVSAELVREHEDFWRISYGVRYQHAVVAGLAEGIALQSQAWLGLFTALLTELGSTDPATDARLLFAAMDGLFQHYVLDSAHYPLDAVVERLVHQFAGPAKES